MAKNIIIREARWGPGESALVVPIEDNEQVVSIMHPDPDDIRWYVATITEEPTDG